MSLPMVWFAVIDDDRPLSDLFSFDPFVTTVASNLCPEQKDQVTVKITIERVKSIVRL